MTMKFFKFFLILIFFAFPISAFARENVSYWYIKDFQQEIIVNKDSSLDITENIAADAGSCSTCHGIFRILSTREYLKNKTIDTPIKLISITDFNGRPIKYSQNKSYLDNTITWKIGDPNVLVTGENNYRIKYHVDNAIRFDNSQFDEFYWNLNGNFWDLEIDNFRSEIIFPDEISKDNSEVFLYSGPMGSTTNTLAEYKWSENALIVQSNGTLAVDNGITTSVTFPKNIFTPYQPGFFTTYGPYFSFLIPILVFIICFWLWAKYGRDPKIKGPVVPEFEIPEKMSPSELGVVITNGKLRPKYITAEIINLAVKGIIKIEKVTSKSFLGSAEDYKLTLLDRKFSKTTHLEDFLVEKLFGGGKEVKISDLRNEFYTEIPLLEDEAVKIPEKKKLISKSGACTQFLFITLAVMFFSLAFFSFIISAILGLNLFISSIILIIFAILIPRRTVEAVKMLKKIDGFKLYMETAEKYRQRFNEKENIFEKYLPYAMVFGITKLWIEKMKVIYGEEYFNTYHPIWFTGAALASFDADSFDSAISAMSSNMSSTISSSPSSSGSGGGGFSGGGGGGGGGGGW